MGCGHSPPPDQTPPGQTSPGLTPPPAQCMLGYTHTPTAQCMLGYGQQAGGTNPTGMHTCFSKISHGYSKLYFTWKPTRISLGIICDFYTSLIAMPKAKAAECPYLTMAIIMSTGFCLFGFDSPQNLLDSLEVRSHRRVVVPTVLDQLCGGENREFVVWNEILGILRVLETFLGIPSRGVTCEKNGQRLYQFQ